VIGLKDRVPMVVMKASVVYLTCSVEVKSFILSSLVSFSAVIIVGVDEVAL